MRLWSRVTAELAVDWWKRSQYNKDADRYIRSAQYFTDLGFSDFNSLPQLLPAGDRMDSMRLRQKPDASDAQLV
jgi:hypothetical protein